MKQRQATRRLKSIASTNPILRGVYRIVKGVPRPRLPNFAMGVIRLPKIKLKTGSTFLVVILGLIAGVVIVLMLGINPQIANFDDRLDLPKLQGPDVNITLIGYEKTKDGFLFIDFLGILSIDQSQGEHKMLMISPEISVKSPGGQSEKLRNVFNLAETQNHDQIAALTLSLERFTGIKIDRYIAFDIDQTMSFFTDVDLKYIAQDDVADTDAGEFKQGDILNTARLRNYLAAEEGGEAAKQLRLGQFARTQFLNWVAWQNLPQLIIKQQELTNILATDLNREELISLATTVLGSRYFEIGYFGADELQAIEDDGSRKYIPLLDKTDVTVAKLFGREDIIKEQARIEVFNATKVGGLASLYSRMFRNLGSNVIRTGNFPDTSDRTRIYVEDIAGLVANVNMLREVFSDQVSIIEEDYPYNHTGDIVVVLGEDAIGNYDL